MSNKLRATASVNAKFLSILHTKKTTLSILHTHFYKTPTSIYLFYNLFNKIFILLQFFYYFLTHYPSLSQTQHYPTINPHPTTIITHPTTIIKENQIPKNPLNLAKSTQIPKTPFNPKESQINPIQPETH